MSSSTIKDARPIQPGTALFTVSTNEVASILNGTRRIDWGKIIPFVEVSKLEQFGKESLCVYIRTARTHDNFEEDPCVNLGMLPTCRRFDTDDRPTEPPPPSTLTGDPLTEAVNSCLTISRAALNVLQKLVGQDAARGR